MNIGLEGLGFLRKLTWEHVLIILAVLVLARVLVLAVRWALRQAAERVAPRPRLAILRVTPLLRLLIDLTSLIIIVPILVEPTFQNVAALAAAVALALAFSLKDYVSSLVAGVTTVLENTYQPGDWIEVDGAYGEVKSIGIRAVHLVTVDDTEVIIPHSRIWTSGIANASSGSHAMLCVADFYLAPDHNAAAVRARLKEIAEASPYRQPETPVVVIVLEKPWGTHYRVKTYVKESREQFLLTSDLTVRGKDALRQMQIKFAQAVYAERGK